MKSNGGGQRVHRIVRTPSQCRCSARHKNEGVARHKARRRVLAVEEVAVSRGRGWRRPEDGGLQRGKYYWQGSMWSRMKDTGGLVRHCSGLHPVARAGVKA